MGSSASLGHLENLLERVGEERQGGRDGRTDGSEYAKGDIEY